MDIASVEGITAFQASQLKEQVNTKVLAKSLDVAKAQGEAVVELLEEAVQIAGGHSGGRLDVQA